MIMEGELRSDYLDNILYLHLRRASQQSAHRLCQAPL